MVHHLLTGEDVKEFKEIFLLLNTSKSGILSRQEIIDGFREKCSIVKGEKEFLDLINRIDSDGSGSIEFEEFVRACIDKSVILSEAKLRVAFDMFDLDGGGTISIEELQGILGLDAKFSKAVWNEIISSFSGSHGNEINFEDFKNLMRKLK